MTTETSIPVEPNKLAAITETLCDALATLHKLPTLSHEHAYTIGHAEGAILLARELVARLHPSTPTRAGAAVYDYYAVEHIDATERDGALRDLVSGAARTAKQYAEATHPDDWRLCRVAMEEVAKTAVDLKAYAERRSIL